MNANCLKNSTSGILLKNIYLKYFHFKSLIDYNRLRCVFDQSRGEAIARRDVNGSRKFSLRL